MRRGGERIHNAGSYKRTLGTAGLHRAGALTLNYQYSRIANCHLWVTL